MQGFTTTDLNNPRIGGQRRIPGSSSAELIIAQKSTISCSALASREHFLPGNSAALFF